MCDQVLANNYTQSLCLSLDLLRWLVVGVATYAAVLMLAGARRAGQPASD